jgi:hypothetical protein
VHTVLIDGVVRKRHGQLTGIDAAEVRRSARASLGAVCERIGGLAR